MECACNGESQTQAPLVVFLSSQNDSALVRPDLALEAEGRYDYFILLLISLSFSHSSSLSVCACTCGLDP